MLFMSDEGDLYGCDGAIWAYPLAGGEAKPIVEGLCAPSRLAYAAGELYFVRHSGYVTPHGALERVDVATGEVTTIAGALISPDAIAADETHVYVGAHVSVGLQSRGKVLRVDRATSEITELATSDGRPAVIVLDPTHVYWGSSVGFLNGKENFDSSVLRIEKTGGEPSTLLDALAWPHGMSRDGDRLYVAHSHGDEVLSLRANGDDVRAVATDLHAPQGVAVDDGVVYFGEWGDPPGALRRVDAAAQSASEVHVSASGAVDQVVLGATCVYWTELYTTADHRGSVRRAPR